MKIWVVAELDSVFPNSGTIVGVFTDKKLARDFVKEKRNRKTGKIISLVGWDENETIPIGERGVI
jgi:hypothetical protein